jgi:hypothetical protein
LRSGTLTLTVAATTVAVFAVPAAALAAGTGALAYTAYSAHGGRSPVAGAGGKARTLTPPSLAASNAAWSPDGRRIAFSAASGLSANS